MQHSPSIETNVLAGSNSGVVWKALRAIVLSFFFLMAASAFLLSLNSLCDALGFYVTSGETSALTRLTEGRISRPLADSSYEWNRAADLLTGSDEGKSEHLVLTISTDGRSAQCVYALTGPADRIDAIGQKVHAEIDGFVDQLLGAVVVNGHSIHFNRLAFDATSTNGLTTLTFQSSPVTVPEFLEVEFLQPPKTQHLRFANKDVLVDIKATHLQLIDFSNIERTVDANRYRVIDAKAGSARLSINLEDTSRDRAQPLASMMEQSGLVSIPFLGDLVETLLWAVPYILLLQLVAKMAPERAGVYRRAVFLVLLLQCGVALLEAVRFDLGTMATSQPWLQQVLLRVTCANGPIRPMYQQPAQFCVLLFAGLLWPNLVDRYLQPDAKQAPLRMRRKAVSILFALLISAALLTAWILNVDSFGPLACMFQLLGVSMLALFWVLWELIPLWDALRKTMLGGFLIAVLGAAIGLPNFLSAPTDYRALLIGIAVSITLLLGIRMAIALLRLSSPLVRSQRFEQYTRNRWVKYGVAFMLCFPTTWLHDSTEIYWGQLGPLVFVLRNIFIFAVIAAFLRFLQEQDCANRWPSLSQRDIDCGIALGITAFFSTNSVWFYFPIPLIAGYALLRWFLLVKPEYTAVAAKFSGEWKGLVKSALKLRGTEQLCADLQKGLRDKLTKGEIQWDDYQSRVDLAGAKAQVERDALLRDGCPIDKVLFSYGTIDSAWKSGCSSAVLSMVFALPWILLSIRDLLKEPSGESYLLLYFLGSATMIVARWALYGFFFGYFYAYLRGRNGFQKALALWFTLVTPSVLASVVSSSLDRQSLAPLLFWVAQVFLHCMLLGLFVGELQQLWKAELSWRQLLDFHNVTGLSVWGTSFLLAMGAAITTAASSGLGSLIAQGLKYAGVLPSK